MRRLRSVLGCLVLFTLAPAAKATELVFTPVTPCRVIDTRISTSPPAGQLAAGSTTTFTIHGGASYGPQGGAADCGIPGLIGSPGSLANQALAVSINIIAVAPSGSGDMRAYPSNHAKPLSSVINYSPETPPLNLANGVIVSMCDEVGASPCAAGDISFSVDVGGAYLVVDVTGYFSHPALSFFSQFGGDGSSGTPDFSTGGFVANSIEQYASLTIPSGKTVQTSNGFTYIGVQGTCTLAGALVAATIQNLATGANLAGGRGNGSGIDIGPLPAYATATITVTFPTLSGKFSGPVSGTAYLAASIPFCRGGRGGWGAAEVAPAGTQELSGFRPPGGPARGQGPGGGGPLGEILQFQSGGVRWQEGLLAQWISCGGGGGGAGEAHQCTSGGGVAGFGGAGGGVIYMECGALDFSGQIHANGGAGTNGTGSCGGGGGGGGGFILIRTRRIISNTGSITANGGAIGTGGDASLTALAGTAGDWQVMLVP